MTELKTQILFISFTLSRNEHQFYSNPNIMLPQRILQLTKQDVDTTATEWKLNNRERNVFKGFPCYNVRCHGEQKSKVHIKYEMAKHKTTVYLSGCGAQLHEWGEYLFVPQCLRCEKRMKLFCYQWNGLLSFSLRAFLFHILNCVEAISCSYYVYTWSWIHIHILNRDCECTEENCIINLLLAFEP